MLSVRRRIVNLSGHAVRRLPDSITCRRTSHGCPNKLSRNDLTFAIEPNTIEVLNRVRDPYERTLGQQPLTGADQAVLVATGITLQRLTRAS